jgi:hypothetical protein
MKTYSLTKAGKEFAKDVDPKTHAGAVIAAIKNLGGKATAAQVIEKATPTLEKVSSMRPNKAVSFMLFDCRRRGLLTAK